MTQGLGRFEFFLIQLDELLNGAAVSTNPALFLYKNDARTKAFMLEGLSRLYGRLHNKKTFTYCKDYFKQLEDMIGAIDFYDSFAKEFEQDAEMPTTLKMFMETRMAEQLSILNKSLIEKKWIKNSTPRTKKIRKKLKTADWLSPENEVRALEELYKKETEEIIVFYHNTGEEFSDIEEEVHEIRRQLRWLSIYPQAMRGAIQLVDNNIKDENLAKYLTDDIINSPFNKMPLPGKNTSFFLLEKNYFLALSKVISRLGEIKDKGLKILATAEAVHHTQFVKEDIALERAYTLNNMEADGLQQIMNEAKQVCKPFFEENNLVKMLAGVKIDAAL